MYEAGFVTYFVLYCQVISLLQAGVVLVDGEAITRLPSRPLTNHTDLTISKVGHNVVSTFTPFF